MSKEAREALNKIQELISHDQGDANWVKLKNVFFENISILLNFANQDPTSVSEEDKDIHQHARNFQRIHQAYNYFKVDNNGEIDKRPIEDSLDTIGKYTSSFKKAKGEEPNVDHEVIEIDREYRTIFSNILSGNIKAVMAIDLEKAQALENKCITNISNGPQSKAGFYNETAKQLKTAIDIKSQILLTEAVKKTVSAPVSEKNEQTLNYAESLNNKFRDIRDNIVRPVMGLNSEIKNLTGKQQGPAQKELPIQQLRKLGELYNTTITVEREINFHRTQLNELKNIFITSTTNKDISDYRGTLNRLETKLNELDENYKSIIEKKSEIIKLRVEKIKELKGSEKVNATNILFDDYVKNNNIEGIKSVINYVEKSKILPSIMLINNTSSEKQELLWNLLNDSSTRDKILNSIKADKENSSQVLTILRKGDGSNENIAKGDSNFNKDKDLNKLLLKVSTNSNVNTQIENLNSTRSSNTTERKIIQSSQSQKSSSFLADITNLPKKAFQTLTGSTRQASSCQESKEAYKAFQDKLTEFKSNPVIQHINEIGSIANEKGRISAEDSKYLQDHLTEVKALRESLREQTNLAISTNPKNENILTEYSLGTYLIEQAEEYFKNSIQDTTVDAAPPEAKVDAAPIEAVVDAALIEITVDAAPVDVKVDATTAESTQQLSATDFEAKLQNLTKKMEQLNDQWIFERDSLPENFQNTLSSTFEKYNDLASEINTLGDTDPTIKINAALFNQYSEQGKKLEGTLTDISIAAFSKSNREAEQTILQARKNVFEAIKQLPEGEKFHFLNTYNDIIKQIPKDIDRVKLHYQYEDNPQRRLDIEREFSEKYKNATQNIEKLDQDIHNTLANPKLAEASSVSISPPITSIEHETPQSEEEKDIQQKFNTLINKNEQERDLRKKLGENENVVDSIINNNKIFFESFLKEEDMEIILGDIESNTNIVESRIAKLQQQLAERNAEKKDNHVENNADNALTAKSSHFLAKEPSSLSLTELKNN